MNENSSPALDGSEVGRVHEQLANRLRTILSFAANSRRQGKGILALSETDSGLSEILEIINDLQPRNPIPNIDNPESNVAWPKFSATRKKKLKKLAGECTSLLAHDAKRLLKLAGPCVGEFPINSNWSLEASPETNSMRYSPKAYFLNAVYRGGDTGLKVLPVLERLFGGSVDAFIRQILAFSRFESELIRLSGVTGYFDNEV